MPEVAIPTTSAVNAAPRPLQPTSLRDILKEATAGAHARLDAKLRADDLRTLAGYRRFLQNNAAALLPLEDALRRAGVMRLLCDWEQRSRAAAIMADLAIVGGSLPPSAPIRLAGDSAVLGTLYVLEGSRLGARYLLRHVKASREARVYKATSYLGHGAGPPFWPDFLGILERHRRLVDAGAMVQAADQAFAMFHDAAGAP